MADNIQRSKGVAPNYRFDRGGMSAIFGPFVGVVKNNVDPTRQGRLEVFIEQLAGNNPDDTTVWRTSVIVLHFTVLLHRNQEKKEQLIL